jgi:hypothetical protein
MASTHPWQVLASLEALEDWLFDGGANAKAAAYQAKRNATI